MEQLQSDQTAATSSSTTSQPPLLPPTPQRVNPPPITIDEFDESYIRLCKMQREAIEPLFSHVLAWSNPRWNLNIHFKDYLISQGVDISQVKKILNTSQRDKFMNPSPENKPDITMIFVFLKFSELLAGINDEKWTERNGSDPELSLTSLKNVRNEIAHNLSVNKERCSDIIKRTYELTMKIQEGLKPVVLRGVVNAEDKEEIEREIDTVFDTTRQKIEDIGKGGIGAEVFDEYQREIDFQKKKKLVLEEGLPSLKKCLEKLKSITPIHLIISNHKIPVGKIFTEMKLEGESGPCSVPIENVLNHAPHDGPSRLLLIMGLAGMGKTTLLKKIFSDWLSKNSDIIGLFDFDLIFYMECRDSIESFKDLLVASLGKVHQKFQGNELIDVCLALKCLLIIDGYDELNHKSARFLHDILTLKKYHNLSVIVTTRPEFKEKFNKQVDSDHTSVSTISVEGIPEEKTEEFVRKYYAGLGSDISPLPSLDELLQYLNKTKYIMGEVWGLPLNLAVVTILWMNKPEVISNISTEAELYLQFFLLSRSKLKERLLKNSATAHFAESFLDIKTKQLIEKLCCESFEALKKDEIIIPGSTIKKYSTFCHRLGVPAEELTGAFLKKVTTSQGSPQYSFPHKGTMEFMAAYYIFLKVTGQCWDPSGATEPNDMATVTNIFERLHGGRLPESLHKYQNMLIQMISLFHVGDGDEIEVSQKAKIEALELLVLSGVNNKTSVLKILKNIKCDANSSGWIAQRFKLFDRDTKIEDHTIDAYIALLRATDAPLTNRDEINIRIYLMDTNGLVELQRQLSRHFINPSELRLWSHFGGVSDMTLEETESIKNLITKDCEYYRGIWNPTFQFPPKMKLLDVRLLDHPSLDAFCGSLEKTKEIFSLVIRFSISDVSSVSRPIPFLVEDPRVYVEVSDVKEGDIEKVGDILRALQQQDERRSFRKITFPCCSLKRQELIKQLKSLKGVRVRNGIWFPEDIRPDDEALRKEAVRTGRESTGCRSVRWTNYFI